VSGGAKHFLSPVGVDDYLPGHGDARYAVEHYDLTLNYKLVGNQLTGRARITAVALQDLAELTLDLHGLRVSRLSIEGPPGVAKHTARRGKVAVTPKAPVKAGSRFTLVVAYSGSPAPQSERLGGWEELADGVLVAGQPGGAPSWFPCNDRPSNKASFRMSISAPSDYVVVANGVCTSTQRRASATTWVFEQAEPTATYLATVQIGRYFEVQLASTPVPMRLFLPARLMSSAPAAFGRQTDMMNLFARLFGPYPLSAYTVVVTDDELEIPLEAQGLSVFGSNFLRSDWNASRLVAHELSHQWFGNSLTLGTWRDIWLHEGFACYAEWLWSEESGGKSAHDMASQHWARLDALRQDIVVGDPGPALMFDDRVYKRGALTLHALRLTMGDDRFFDMLRDWVESHAGGTVSTDEFVTCASEHTGADVADLVNAWLLREPLPALPSAH
jgi:aminopeptidase N